MISSQPCRTAASTATLTLAVPTIFRRSAAGRSRRSSKHGTDTTRAEMRRLRIFERELPAFDRLDRVAGTEDIEVRDGAQRGEMLDRLVGRTVFAEPDRIVGHHVNDAFARERGQP